MSEMFNLWVSVLLQAVEDLASEPVDSAPFNEARAFFTGGGKWAESRRLISEFLEVHPEELQRIGQRHLAAREARGFGQRMTLDTLAVINAQMPS